MTDYAHDKQCHIVELSPDSTWCIQSWDRERDHNLDRSRFTSDQDLDPHWRRKRPQILLIMLSRGKSDTRKHQKDLSSGTPEERKHPERQLDLNTELHFETLTWLDDSFVTSGPNDLSKKQLSSPSRPKVFAGLSFRRWAVANDNAARGFSLDAPGDGFWTASLKWKKLRRRVDLDLVFFANVAILNVFSFLTLSFWFPYYYDRFPPCNWLQRHHPPINSVVWNESQVSSCLIGPFLDPW